MILHLVMNNGENVAFDIDAYYDGTFQEERLEAEMENITKNSQVIPVTSLSEHKRKRFANGAAITTFDIASTD